mmetsp:Transcript_7424/g.10811  ORF Transcript_7424/g.10811 Transcript_7424/m.10811 type:complete len:394 (-) Transcript_7424:37-1218(-)
MNILLITLFFQLTHWSAAFVKSPVANNKQLVISSPLRIATNNVVEDELAVRKKELLNLLGRNNDSLEEGGVVDPVLCDPVTKEPLRIVSKISGPILFGESKGKLVEMQSSSNKYSGSSETFFNLLNPIDESESAAENQSLLQQASRQLSPFIPPPLRSVLSFAGIDESYIPMRDLFTSPTVSYAYERGWRQGFAQAGFPGAEREFVMATEYFAPALQDEDNVVVDMSCATGLFTRRFAAKDAYARVLGCDYSESMLTECRRRLKEQNLPESLKKTHLDLVQLDVGQIPMKDSSIDVLHAGAAMHCWPDLDGAISEIHRVLKPGGRYFATTFLSTYFSTLNRNNDESTPVTQMAFQNFESTDRLKELLVRNGFDSDKTFLEVLGNACVVIRCEK